MSVDTIDIADFISPDSTDPRILGVPIEAKLQEWNIPYTYVADYSIDLLQVIESAQVREGEHRVNDEQAEEYRQQMDAGAIFPPIVVMDPVILIDGNTRIAALRRMRGKGKTFPAFVATFPTTALARAFAASMNQRNGRRLTTSEAKDAALALLDAGYAEGSVSLEIGYSRTQVGKWKNQQKFASAARRANRVSLTEELPTRAQESLGQIASDPVAMEAAQAIIESGAKGRQVTEIVRAAKGGHSEAEALNAIAATVKELSPSGPPPHKPQVTPALKTFRMVAGQLLKFVDVPSDFVEFDVDRRPVVVEQWRALGVLAGEVLRAYGE